jgi:SnoaL-like domain
MAEPLRDARSLEDHRQIVELGARYAQATDARDFTAVAGCFTAGGTLETVIPPNLMQGRARIEADLQVKTSTVLAAQHLVTNHLYEIRGDEASGTASFVMFRWLKQPAADGPACGAVAHGGTYHDWLVRTGQGWLFSRRRIEILWGPGTLTAPAADD